MRVPATLVALAGLLIPVHATAATPGLTVTPLTQVEHTGATRCIKRYVADGGTSQLGLVPTDVETLIENVARAIGLGLNNVFVVACTDGSMAAQKVVATYEDGKEEGIPLGEYVAYDPTWVREVIGDDEVQATALFAHELGHLLARHYTTSRNLPRAKKELEADSFMGCALARRDMPFAPLVDLLSRIRPEVAGFYPAATDSIAAARQSYKDCGGRLVDDDQLDDGDEGEPIPDLPVVPDVAQDFKVLYFQKAADGNAVLDVLAQNNIDAEVRRGENNVPTNIVTCTPDVDFDAVKTIAKDLLRGGIELKSIHLADVTPMPTNRISIESESHYNDLPTLTAGQVDGLRTCGSIKLKTKPLMLTTRNCTDLKIMVSYHDQNGHSWRATRNVSSDNSSYLNAKDGTVAEVFRPYYYYARSELSGNTWADFDNGRLIDVDGEELPFVKSSKDELVFECDLG